jgi:mannosyl-oligosaccharide alpha-1,2-mannosidase
MKAMLIVGFRYRLTGDRKWQEKGWKMFVSWVTAARVDGGLSSIADVTKHVEEIRYTDNMESFMFAETLKWVLERSCACDP